MDISSVDFGTDELLSVAKWQKYNIWMILIQVLILVLSIGMAISSKTAQRVPNVGDISSLVTGLSILVARIVIWVLSMYGVYMLAKALRMSGAILYAIAMFLPLISLLVLLVLNDKATKVLQNSGVRVGLMGADCADLERISAMGSQNLQSVS